jgi:hypothetical protein
MKLEPADELAIRLDESRRFLAVADLGSSSDTAAIAGKLLDALTVGSDQAQALVGWLATRAGQIRQARRLGAPSRTAELAVCVRFVSLAGEVEPLRASSTGCVHVAL